MGELTIRLVRNTIAAAGILGALVVATGPAADGAVAGAPVATTAVVDTASVRPMQPPPPPPGWPPPALQQPGQQGPAPGQQDDPPPPSTPTGDPICQDIMNVPNINAPCYDPSATA